MSRTIYRFLLTCVLLVVMPLQGLAATSRLACGPNHHRTVTAADVGAMSTSGVVHHHADGSAHEHAVQRASDTTSTGMQQTDPATGALQWTESSTRLDAGLKCNACAPCCGGALLTSDTSPVIAAPVHSADFPPFVDVQRSAHVGSLYRPPKAILA